MNNVIIIGGGIAGLCAAISLQKNRIRCKSI
ncbi:FAD-binding protein [Bacillus cereus]